MPLQEDHSGDVIFKTYKVYINLLKPTGYVLNQQV